MVDRKTEILIVGAGIGGLSLALSLHDQGYCRVKVAERAPKVGALGVGLNVLPNAIKELDALGLLPALDACAIRTRELAFYNRFGTRIWSEPRGIAAGYRWPQLSIQRRHLQQVLLDAVEERLGDKCIVPGFHAVHIEQRKNAGVIVSSESGATLRADVVVAADGVHSAIRRHLSLADMGARSSGMVMWRGTTWAPRFLSGATMAVVGDDRDRMVFYPVAPSEYCPTTEGRAKAHVLVNWVACRPAFDRHLNSADWSQHASAEQVMHYFSDWAVPWLDVQDVLRNSNQVYLYPLIDRDPLDSWSLGRVTLLGDAAHAMHPNGSNGATQAIIDARVFAHSMSCASDVEEALHQYEVARRPAMTALQLSNRQRGPEAVISLAHQRAPHGFGDIREVFSEQELHELSQNYARTGGFDVKSVNEGPLFGPNR